MKLPENAWTRTMFGRVLIKRLKDAGVPFRVEGRQLSFPFKQMPDGFEDLLYTQNCTWYSTIGCNFLPSSGPPGLLNILPEIWATDYEGEKKYEGGWFG